MTATQALLEHEKNRVETLEKLRAQLQLAQSTEIERNTFTELFGLALRVLEIKPDDVTALFKISRPTVSRWMNGESAPHPLGRGPVFELFDRKAAEKLRILNR